MGEVARRWEVAGMATACHPGGGRACSGAVRFAAALLLVLGTSLSVLAIASLGPLAVGVSASSVPPGAVNVEPSIRPTRYPGANPESWWCVMPNCTSDFDAGGQGPMPTVQRELQEARSLGVAYVRVEFPWALIEPSRGSFDWSRSDAIFQAAAQTGVNLLPILIWTPPWAGGGATFNQPAANVSDWTAFVTDFSERYRPRLRAVEVWNEPDGGTYLYNGSAQTYVSQILNPAYAAIKAVSGSTLVVGGGAVNDAGACCSFLSAMLQAGARFDAVSFHNYAGNYVAEAQSYRSVLQSAGRGSTPIWMTEFGVQSNQGDQSSAIQSVFTGSDPLALAAWYNLRDTNSYTCCPPSPAAYAQWGLLNADFSAKPAFATMQAAEGHSALPPPPPWSAPPTSAPPPASTASSTPRRPSGTPSPSPSPSPSAAALSPAASPSAGSGSASTTGRPAAGRVTASSGATSHGGGPPWLAIALPAGGVVAAALGVACWLIPGLRRLLPGLPPP